MEFTNDLLMFLLIFICVILAVVFFIDFFSLDVQALLVEKKYSKLHYEIFAFREGDPVRRTMPLGSGALDMKKLPCRFGSAPDAHVIVKSLGPDAGLGIVDSVAAAWFHIDFAQDKKELAVYADGAKQLTIRTGAGQLIKKTQFVIETETEIIDQNYAVVLTPEKAVS